MFSRWGITVEWEDICTTVAGQDFLPAKARRLLDLGACIFSGGFWCVCLQFRAPMRGTHLGPPTGLTQVIFEAADRPNINK